LLNYRSSNIARHLISSPVSRLPIAARSYLTTAVILLLVLIAIHFSIQAWGQQQARQWVAEWEKQTGGHVGEVRLHMLRGALTIHDMQWDAKGIHFYAPFMLLRGNLSDSIEQVDIREVATQGVKIAMSQTFFQHILSQKDELAAFLPWAKLLDDVRNIRANDMAITVRAGADGVLPLQPLIVQHAKFSSSLQQQWTLSGALWGGKIDLSSQAHGQAMVWSNLDAEKLTESLGLATIKGLVHGKMHWFESHISGSMQWQGQPSHSDYKNNVFEANLDFKGVKDQSGWQGDIQAVDWPLQIFSAYAPVWHERTLKSAYLTGSLHIKNKQQGWQVSMREGSMRHLDYGSQSQAAWLLQQIAFKKATLVWPQRRLRMHDIIIAQGSWAVDSHAVEASKALQGWTIDFPKVVFEAVTLGDIAKNIWLPDVHGKLSFHDQTVSMKAGSNSQAMGVWTLQALGNIGQGPRAMNVDIKVQAEHVPLLNFRDTLPQNFVKDARLNGDVRLDLGGTWNSSGWQLSGDMDGQNIIWNRGSWLWRAADMKLEGVVFSSYKTPYAETWQVHDWSGQTSLSPWAHASNMKPTQEHEDSFSLDGWKVKHIHLGHGRFSLGQEDAVWFESDAVNLDKVAENQEINLQVQGRLADGRFALQAAWYPWGRTPWISLDASLKQALPFVAAPWLQLSGLPILTRGRISADINIKNITKQVHHYQGNMQFHLNYGKLHNGVSSNALLSEVTGYEAHGLFDRINRHGHIDLDIPLQGNWVYTPLSSSMLGKAMLAALTEQAAVELKPLPSKESTALYSIRLHDLLDGHADTLNHNERVRLRKVMHVLKRKRKWIIELQPQLGKEELNASMINRVRKTQSQITAFLVARGISASRIFPVWPEEANRHGESTGILIQAVK